MQLGQPLVDLTADVASLLNVITPILIVTGVISGGYSAFRGDWFKAAVFALTPVFMLFSLQTVSSFLISDVSGPGAVPAVDPFAGIQRYFGTIVIGIIGVSSLAGLCLLIRYGYRQRKQRHEAQQARQTVSSLRYEYSEWLEEEALKLEIDALSAPSDPKVHALLERVQEARNHNLLYLQASQEEPVLRDAIQNEWDQLRTELSNGGLFPAFTPLKEADLKKK